MAHECRKCIYQCIIHNLLDNLSDASDCENSAYMVCFATQRNREKIINEKGETAKETYQSLKTLVFSLFRGGFGGSF